MAKAFLHLGAEAEKLDLGDVAAGGMDSGTGTAPGIDLLRGVSADAWSTDDVVEAAQSPEARFHASRMPFIDGLFIPDRGATENHMVMIASSGLKVELPGTTSRSWGHLKTGIKVPPEQMFDPTDAEKLGPRYLWMPGNQGIFPSTRCDGAKRGAIHRTGLQSLHRLSSSTESWWRGGLG